MTRRFSLAEQLALLVTELTLVAATLAAIVGFERLFSDEVWRRPLILTVAIGHGVAMLLRRLRLPSIVAVVAFLGAGAIAITYLLYDTTSSWYLPTGTTLDTLRPDLEAARDIFSTAIAPTPAIPGFVLMAAAAVWILVGIADAIAFRARLTLPALIPMAAIVVFIASLGSDVRRTPLLVLVLGASLVFVVTHRSLLLPADHTWLGNLTDARSAMARLAAPVAVLAGLFAIATVPFVPGSTDSLVQFSSSGPGDPARVVISPLVDIRGRLVSQQDVEVFQVRSPEPAYWRLTALDTFNNQVWSSRADYDGAGSELEPSVVSGAGNRTVSQQFRIQALAAVWLPAAFQPDRMVDVEGASVQWEPDSATLIVQNGTPTSDGIEYTIESAVPEFRQTDLSALPFGFPVDFERFTELPADFSPLARDLAQEIAGDIPSPYGQAMALQTFFRSSFTYDINVAAGHDVNRIEDFLALRQGYCEQFAGTFAAMARSLGLPARVAVGFTWGDNDPLDPTLFRVRGEHAHAWTEVYIDGAGWVLFEPTPGRGAPGAAYTEVSPAQDETGISEDVAGSPLVPAIPDLPPNVLDALAGLDEGSTLAPGAGGTVPDSSFTMPGWVLAVAVIAGVALSVVAAFPFLRRRLRRTHHRAHLDHLRRRVLAAWDDAVTSVAPLGLRPTGAETTTEFARRAVPLLGPQPRFLDLAHTVDRARYSPDPLDESEAADAEAAGHHIENLAHDRTTWWDRYRVEFDFNGRRRR
jgi:transglutaminase-like putative cysteine protease